MGPDSAPGMGQKSEILSMFLFCSGKKIMIKPLLLQRHFQSSALLRPLRCSSMLRSTSINLLSNLQFFQRDENKILRAGEELWRESLPLNGSSRLYHLQDLKPQTWYEVKISYPASIPACFAIQLEKDMVLNNNRRLLNTEKLIFKTGSNLDKMRVLVTVKAEGFVAIPRVPDRPFIIFNIVCDELLLGVAQQAWWVVVLAILCLGIAFWISFFHPPYLLPKNQNVGSTDGSSKTS